MADALYRPINNPSRPWVARANGALLTDKRGVTRHWANRAAALAAAQAAEGADIEAELASRKLEQQP